MQLIQIGAPQQNKAATIREMFEKMSQREAEMIRSARERMNQSSARGN